MIAKINLDKVGIGASLLCAVHCVLLPILFTTLPLMGIELLENKNVELGFIVFSFAVGCLGLYTSYKKHHHKTLPLLLFVIGISCLLSSNYLLGESMEAFGKITGASIIIMAHIINWRHCKSCKICK